VVDRVKEAFDIGIQYPVHLLARDRHTQGIKRLMGEGLGDRAYGPWGQSIWALGTIWALGALGTEHKS
jgi:hypothetical protein